MWDALALLGQKELLQAALKSFHLSSPTMGQQDPKVLIVVVTNTMQQSTNLVKPPPFYVIVIISKYLIHNCMIDSGATSSLMPKNIADQ